MGCVDRRRTRVRWSPARGKSLELTHHAATDGDLEGLIAAGAAAHGEGGVQTGGSGLGRDLRGAGGGYNERVGGDWGNAIGGSGAEGGTA